MFYEKLGYAIFAVYTNERRMIILFLMHRVVPYIVQHCTICVQTTLKKLQSSLSLIKASLGRVNIVICLTSLPYLSSKAIKEMIAVLPHSFQYCSVVNRFGFFSTMRPKKLKNSNKYVK